MRQQRDIEQQADKRAIIIFTEISAYTAVFVV